MKGYRRIYIYHIIAKILILSLDKDVFFKNKTERKNILNEYFYCFSNSFFGGVRIEKLDFDI